MGSNQDNLDFDMLLQPLNFSEAKDIENDGYQMASLHYNYEADTFKFKLQEFAKAEEESGLSKTKPHTLRSVWSRACTIMGRLYIMHNLQPKDESLPKTSIKTPIRIMDFQLRRLLSVEFLNDDSTGNKRGEADEKKDTFLPLTIRINYSIANHKTKLFIYGGLNEKNQVLNSMEIFDACICKFQPVKYRGDSKPVARQGHSAVVLNRYSMLIIGGTYQDKLLSPTPVPENDQIWSYDMEAGTWNQVKIKNQGGSEGNDDLVPWNLVNHTTFKLDEHNIGCLWSHEDSQMMISIFNCRRCIWKNINILSSDSFKFRFGASVYPIYDMECDRVSKIMILGGIDMQDQEQQAFPVTQVQFMEKLPEGLSEDKAAAPKIVGKKFKEDE